MQFCNDKNYTFLPCTTCGAYHLLLLLALFYKLMFRILQEKYLGLLKRGFYWTS